MTDKWLESVSALVDDEADAAGVGAIEALLRDEAARRAWARYHVISDCLRGTLPRHIDPGLARRISDALRREATILAPAQGHRSRILKPLAGLAVAASVAAVAILGIRSGEEARDGQSQPAIAVQTPLAPPARTITFASGHPGAQPARAQTTQGRSSARLNRYLVNYNEYRNNAAVQGMIPYVRIVAPENNE